MRKTDRQTDRQTELTLGSLFAGIGGFDRGFEQANWTTKWQVEINPQNRTVLADRFPGARRFVDVRTCGRHNLEQVDCITAGFPCQDISNLGGRRKVGIQGLAGPKSGLVREAFRIIKEVQPTWVVLENVASLLHSNSCRDIEQVIASLAQCNYLGYARVLDAQYFGVPQRRRRVFLVAGLGRYPSLEFLADAAPVEAIPGQAFTQRIPRAKSRWAGHTCTTSDVACRINLGCEVLVAEAHGWRQMARRQGISEVYGIPLGLDARNSRMRFSAGNAVVPAVARWIAEILAKS